MNKIIWGQFKNNRKISYLQNENRNKSEYQIVAKKMKAMGINPSY